MDEETQIDLDIPVTGEADLQELLAILTEITPPRIDREAVRDVIAFLPEAIALWLSKSEPLEDGSRRGEAHGLFILHLRPVEEAEGHGVADGVTIPAHLALHVKAHKGLLDTLEGAFALPVKND